MSTKATKLAQWLSSAAQLFGQSEPCGRDRGRSTGGQVGGLEWGEELCEERDNGRCDLSEWRGLVEGESTRVRQEWRGVSAGGLME